MIPTEVREQMPMLSSTTTETIAAKLAKSGRIFDIKWDGIRALLIIDEGRVTIRNKSGRDATRRYPEIVAAARAAYPNGTRIFDGEILVCNPISKRFDFGLALKRDAQSGSGKIAHYSKMLPATYMAFDLLWVDDTDLRRRPVAKRIAMLEAEPLGPGLQRSMANTDGELMWAAVEQFGFEGLIAKESQSTYRAGSSKAWIKIKRLKRVTAIVNGYEPGLGARQDRVGALHLSVLRDGQLVSIGKVGTGFKARDHQPMLEVLRAGEEFLVEVEYLEFTSDGQLRQPSLKGVRSDVTREDCTMEQLR